MANVNELIETLHRARGDAEKQLVEIRQAAIDHRAAASLVKESLLPEIERHHERQREAVREEFSRLRLALSQREDTLLSRLDAIRDVKAERLLLAADQASANQRAYESMAGNLELACSRNDDLNLLRAKDAVDKRCAELTDTVLPTFEDIAQATQVSFYG